MKRYHKACASGAQQEKKLTELPGTLLLTGGGTGILYFVGGARGSSGSGKQNNVHDK